MIFSSSIAPSAITASVRNYIDGFLGQNTTLLQKAFHAGAKLISVDDEKISELPTSEWFAKIEARRLSGVVPPKAEAAITGVDQAGNAAVVRVRITFPTYEFTDYLSLLKVGEEWVIVNKIYDVR